MNKYLKQLLDALTAKNQELQGHMTKSLDGGSTPDEETEGKIQAVEKDIAAIEVNIERVKKQIAAAKHAEDTGIEPNGENEEGAKDQEGKKKKSVITTESNLPKGIGFAQYARAKLAAALEAKKGNFVSPSDMAKQMGFNEEVQDLVTKATLGTTTDVGFASALVAENRLVGEFVELLRAKTVFDKLTGFKNVPFNSKIPSQLTGGQAQWVGEGAPKPLTNPTYSEVEIKEHKLAAITVYSQELIRRSDPAVDVLVRDDLIEASKTLIDNTFLDAGAATAVRPAGVLNAVVAIPSTGTTAEAYDADLEKLTDKFIEANLSLDGAFYLMSETRASRMSKLRDALGNKYYSGMQGAQKELDGLPVITSQSYLLPTTSLLANFWQTQEQHNLL